MTKQQFFADRNTEIYEAYCTGYHYKTLAIEYEITESSIKRIISGERKLRGLKKTKGKRQ